MFQQQLSYEEVLENKIKSLHSKIERLETELKASEACHRNSNNNALQAFALSSDGCSFNL
jgi:uncharacterized small protein (DUF1192 family)